VDQALTQALDELARLSIEERLERRYQKFRHMGQEGQAFIDSEAAPPPATPAGPKRA
jgi:hypothetical protein